MHWAATLGVVVPTALALLAIYLERRNRKTDRSDAERDAAEAGQRADRAHATADAATAAAERSAAATERMAQALEAQSAAAARAAPTPQAAWTLEHSVGDSYLLTNVGTATAYDVDVGTGDMVVRVPPGTWPRAELPPDDAVKVLAARTMGTRDDTVTLTWATELGGGDRKTWRRPLPPKPPTSSVQRPRAEGHYPNRRPGVPRPIVDGSAGDTAKVATAQSSSSASARSQSWLASCSPCWKC